MKKIAIFVGTVYGNALLVAEKAQVLFEQQGYPVSLFSEGQLSDWQQYQQDIILLITSTTGQGDLPDNISELFYQVRDHYGIQAGLHYGLIALGDSSYPHFCAAGKQFETLLQEQSAQRIGDVLYIDATIDEYPEETALPWLKQWMALLASIIG